MAEQEKNTADVAPPKSNFEQIKDTTKEVVSKLLGFFRQEKTDDDITKKSPSDKILKGIVKALIEKEAQHKEDFTRNKKLEKLQEHNIESKHKEIIKVLLGIPQPEPTIIQEEPEKKIQDVVLTDKKKTTVKPKVKKPTAKRTAGKKPTVKKPRVTKKPANKPKASNVNTTTLSATAKLATGLAAGTIATGALAMPTNTVADAIKKASKETGVSLSLMYAIAKQESGFDPSIKSNSSSATGLFQFIKDTWATIVRTYGGKYPILRERGPTDPEANALAGALYIKENSDILNEANIPVNATTIYTAHFLGPGGTKKLFSLPPDAIAAPSFPSAASANRNIFYKNGNTSQPRTVKEILNLLFEKVGQYEQKYGQVLQNTGTQVSVASSSNKDMKLAAAEQTNTSTVVNNFTNVNNQQTQSKKTKSIDDRNPYERSQG